MHKLSAGSVKPPQASVDRVAPSFGQKHFCTCAREASWKRGKSKDGDDDDDDSNDYMKVQQSNSLQRFRVPFRASVSVSIFQGQSPCVLRGVKEVAEAHLVSGLDRELACAQGTLPAVLHMTFFILQGRSASPSFSAVLRLMG